MGDQGRTLKPPDKKSEDPQDEGQLPAADETGHKIAEDTQALHARIHDALDDVVGAYDIQPTELIGGAAGQQRPEVRAESSEEFLKNFKQKGGQ